MQTIPPAPKMMTVVPKMSATASLRKTRPNSPAVNDTNSPGTTIPTLSTLSPTPIEMSIDSEGHRGNPTVPATLPLHQVPLTQGNLSLLGTSQQTIDESYRASMMDQMTSTMSSFVGLTTYLTSVDVQAIILLLQTSNFNEATFHDTLKSDFGCIDKEAHLLASLAAAGQQDA